MLSEKNSIRNAKIESTTLGFIRGSIMSYYLHLDYEDSGVQSFGGFVLDNPRGNKKERGGTVYGMETIIDILRVAGVEKWEDLKGKYIRVQFGDEPAGFGYNIVAIGHITKDIWFNPKELADDLRLL